MSKFSTGDKVAFCHLGGIEVGIVSMIEEIDDDKDRIIKYIADNNKKRANFESVLFSINEIEREANLFSDALTKMKSL